MITDLILSRTKRLQVVSHPTAIIGSQPDYPKQIVLDSFKMFNDAGTEVEVSELLYSLVRLFKPNIILETGTHLGISSSYMAMGLAHNKKGILHTIEIDEGCLDQAKLLWQDLEIKDYVIPYMQTSMSFNTDMEIELLFLDSAIEARFDEFVKFWPNVIPGGLIIIHDLFRDLGHHKQIFHDQLDWPYGDFREKLGPYIKEHKVQTFTFPTPRGLTIFQKESSDFAFTKYLRGLE
jgi:predicted O-methyltransferase YrrM